MAQINLGGSVGTTGNVGILGNAAVVFAADADHTLLPAEYSNNFLECTSSGSLTATRNLIAPLVQGQCFLVQNRTTGGQAIQVIGSSGTGVLVPNGATVSVVCDGVNYFSVATTTSTWNPLAAGGTVSPTYAQTWWLFDTTGASGTINLPASGTAVDGEVHFFKATGATTPGGLLINAGVGNTIELWQQQGSFSATGGSTTVPPQTNTGWIAGFKYYAANFQWVEIE